MIKVQMIGYRIRKLDMVNNFTDEGCIELAEHMDFSINYDLDNNRLTATYIEYLEVENAYDQFHVELGMEGIFYVEGIKSNKAKKEAHIRCYEQFYPYADKVLRDLLIETGMERFLLQKRDLDEKSVQIGEKPKAVKSEKIIDFQPDTDK